ncbi:hypothetical protein GCM10017577_47790 [Pseudonocardia halophobica]|uniref:Uncharacterized protein n=1 Tax=Pseudonocardia halophobica TaxID=29401 RepID=A0A9W6L655_9PSEU|nr:hypothetical protein GCM10017577_47790 [Pseudonocardia halophobica]
MVRVHGRAQAGSGPGLAGRHRVSGRGPLMRLDAGEVQRMSDGSASAARVRWVRRAHRAKRNLMALLTARGW